jgi:hypothetical protein
LSLSIRIFSSFCLTLEPTVEEGFRIFHGWLTLTGIDTAEAKRQRTTIKTCLESNFGMTIFYRIGSFSNGTSVQGYSDVDYLACIPTKNLKQDSRKPLYAVWEAIDNRFPTTEVGIKSPAIYVLFGTGASLLGRNQASFPDTICVNVCFIR